MFFFRQTIQINVNPRFLQLISSISPFFSYPVALNIYLAIFHLGISLVLLYDLYYSHKKKRFENGKTYQNISVFRKYYFRKEKIETFAYAYTMGVWTPSYQAASGILRGKLSEGLNVIEYCQELVTNNQQPNSQDLN